MFTSTKNKVLDEDLILCSTLEATISFMLGIALTFPRHKFTNTALVTAHDAL